MILFYVFFSEVLSGIYDNNNEKGEAISKHAEIYRNIYFLFFLWVQFFFFLHKTIRFVRTVYACNVVRREKKKTPGQVQFSYKNYKIIAFNKNIFCLFPSEPTYTEPHCMLYGVDDNAIIKYDLKIKKFTENTFRWFCRWIFHFSMFLQFLNYLFSNTYIGSERSVFFLNFLNESFLPLTLLRIAEISLAQHIKS